MTYADDDQEHEQLHAGSQKCQRCDAADRLERIAHTYASRPTGRQNPA